MATFKGFNGLFFDRDRHAFAELLVELAVELLLPHVDGGRLDVLSVEECVKGSLLFSQSILRGVGDLHSLLENPVFFSEPLPFAPAPAPLVFLPVDIIFLRIYVCSVFLTLCLSSC